MKKKPCCYYYIAFNSHEYFILANTWNDYLWEFSPHIQHSHGRMHNKCTKHVNSQRNWTRYLRALVGFLFKMLIEKYF